MPRNKSLYDATGEKFNIRVVTKFRDRQVASRFITLFQLRDSPVHLLLRSDEEEDAAATLVPAAILYAALLH